MVHPGANAHRLAFGCGLAAIGYYLRLIFLLARWYVNSPRRQQITPYSMRKDSTMYYEWKPYVSVANKLANARKYAERIAKKEGRKLLPVKVSGRKLTTTFWGQAWCDNLDQYSDFGNRLARGRRYLGNGSVVDLQMRSGRIEAIVAGSETYKVSIKIKTLPAKTWKSLRQDCSRSIHSLIDLLQGRFDEGVMRRMALANGGLFPHPTEIDMDCSCPDYARVCKHIAAVIYGVGVRLDVSPEMLFTLRSVDHSELISQAVAAENLDQSLTSASNALAGSDLGELFGIDLATSANATAPVTAPPARKTRAKKTTAPAADEIPSQTDSTTATRPKKNPTSKVRQPRSSSSQIKQSPKRKKVIA